MCIVQPLQMKIMFTFQAVKCLVSTTVRNAKPAATFWNFFSRTKNQQFCCLVAMAHNASSKRRVVRTKMKNHLIFWKHFSANLNQPHPNLNKNCQNVSIHGIIIPTPHWLLQLIGSLFPASFYTLSVYSKATWFSQSQTMVMNALESGPDSVTVTVKGLVHEMMISFQEILLAAWSLLLSRRQDFLHNHLARVPVNTNQQGTHEIGDKVLPGVGAQDMDTSGYQLSDLDDVEFYWKNDQMEEDAVFGPGVDTPFSPTAFDDLEMEGTAWNFIFSDLGEDNENSASTTTVSERPARPPALLRSCSFGAGTKNVSYYASRNFFQKVLPCMCVNRNYIKL